MSAGFPCPNPICDYIFARDQVKGAAALKCPRCGSTFQFRAAAQSPPLARRVTPVPAPVAPVRQSQAPADFSTGPIVRPHLMRSRHSGGWKAGLALGTVLLIVAGMVVGGILFGFFSSRQVEEGAVAHDPNVLTLYGQVFNKKGREERAFRLVLPRKVWHGDEKLKRVLHAVVALRRSEPDAWLAVAAEDFGTRMPRDAELLKGGFQRLEGYFGEDLQLDEHPEPAELAGRSAQRLRFRGMVNNVQWEGECFLLARHGLGYWFFMAGAPSMDAAKQALAELQQKGKGFQPDDERRGWTELPPRLEQYTGTHFALQAREGVWQSIPNAKDEDSNAELLLRGRDVENKKDNLRSATLLVLELKKTAPDLKTAMKEARAYLEESKKQEGKYIFTPVVEKKGEAPPDGTPRQIGNQPGQVLELQMLREGVPIKYILLGVVRTPQRLYVFQGEAHWEYHQAWRQDFLDVLRTFRLRGR
jgi:hypothetical protein